MEQGNIMSFENHELWAESLFTSRLREVPQGYSEISFKQIQAADAKLFVVLGEMTRRGTKMTSKGRPCDEIFKDATQSNQVQPTTPFANFSSREGVQSQSKSRSISQSSAFERQRERQERQRQDQQMETCSSSRTPATWMRWYNKQW